MRDEREIIQIANEAIEKLMSYKLTAVEVLAVVGMIDAAIQTSTCNAGIYSQKLDLGPKP